MLRNRFLELSVPQQVALKSLYGVPLDPAHVDQRTGFSEVDYWALFHGAGEFDELGYPVRVCPELAPPYVTEEVREGWLIFGRRAGKTDTFAATIVAYEATCGGHERFLRPRQQGICFQIAQDLRMARNSLHFIRAVLESSPLLSQLIVQITADRIDLSNNFTINCVPATLKSVRGFANPIGVLDEVGVWYQEAESANPDYEVYRALSPGQLQFPDAKIVGVSSPWNKGGLLYQYWEAGTRGYKLTVPGLATQYRECVVLKGPTALMANPQVSREYLAREQARDPRAFEREVMAEFQDSISGFIPTALVEAARDREIFERPFDARQRYHAAMDPAFRRDAFGFTIVHAESGVIIQDVVRRFIAAPGSPLTPGAILDVIVPLCQKYGISLIYSDQYHIESLGQLLRERGMEIYGVTFTAKSKSQMYGNLQQLFLQRKIRLLDDYETLRELKSLERTLTQGGSVQIGAPQGLHDDLASVVCVAASQAMFDRDKEDAAALLDPTPSYKQIIDAQIQRRWAARESLDAWD